MKAIPASAGQTTPPTPRVKHFLPVAALNVIKYILGKTELKYS